MGKGIILRVLEGTVLSPEIRASLSSLLPNHKIEFFSEHPNYRRSIQRRIDSLDSAFAFILKAYPPNPKFTPINSNTLTKYVAECKASCDLTKESLEDLHKELERFTGQLVNVLAVAWKWKEGKEVAEAIDTLNEAEQYVLMGQGRFDLATLTPSGTADSPEYVLQWDESIPPHYDLLLNELGRIKNQGYPKTPLWFRNLKEYQQAYFCHLNGTINDHTDVIKELNQFFSSWSVIKNTALNLSADLAAIKSEKPPLPSWFSELSPQLQRMVKILAKEPNSIDFNLNSFKNFMSEESKSLVFQSSVMNMSKFPTWYWELSERQQYFLEYALKTATSIETAISFLSSRHRTLPAPANFAKHRLLKVNADGIHSIGSERWRSSHVVSRDVLDCSEETQNRHSVSNFTKVTERAQSQQPILLQTLISPMHIKHHMPAVVSNRLLTLPDLDLFERARAMVAHHERAKDTFQHNHPFNMAKYIYWTEANDPDSLALLKAGNALVSQKPELRVLLDQYKSVLDSPLGTATFRDYTGRELFLSSLEHLIIHHLDGFSYGSCVSGKDRKAVELIHTDAMMLYKDRYNLWPIFGEHEENEARKAFVKIIADLYCSRHQQEHAGQNAPGSEGIKTPSSYFPKDVSNLINKRMGSSEALRREDKLASDNEVEKINHHLGSTVFDKNRYLCQLMLLQIGDAKCTELYDALNALINEKSRFKKPCKEVSWSLGLFDKNTDSAIPTGIATIQSIMVDERIPSNVKRLEEIFLIVLGRPESDNTRTEATNSVYTRIRGILTPSLQCESLDVRVEKAIKEWQDLFNISKDVNGGKAFFNELGAW